MADQMPEWSARLLELGRRRGEIPIYGSQAWHALEPVDPRRFAAVVRAAECWRQDGTETALRARLRDEDTLVRARVRLASYDLADIDWRRIQDVLAARRELRGVA